MTISVNCVLKNEDLWVLYAIKSVIDYVDEVIITDTGSSDHTLEILNSIGSNKIKIDQKVIKSPEEFTVIRQNQLKKSRGDWILVLDGDEIWTKESIEKSIEIIKQRNHNVQYLINKYLNHVGDIYHYLPESASNYKLKNRIGPYTIRFFKKDIKGLSWGNPYGSEGLFTSDGNISIQDNDDLNFENIDSPYLHCTHLVRSSGNQMVLMREKKYKYELGLKINYKFEYPQCLYFPTKYSYLNPWKKRSKLYFLRALVQTPFKRVYRFLKNA